MPKPLRHLIGTLAVASWGLSGPASAQVAKPASGLAPIRLPATSPGGLQTYIPEKIGQVPAGNDFNNPESEFSFARSRTSDHFVMFWAREYGANPMENPVRNRRFNPEEVIAAAEKSYQVFIGRLDWAPSPQAYARRFKMLILVTGGKDGTAYGSRSGTEVGTFWTPAVRVNSGPYGVIAHELGHSFQALSRSDGAASFPGMAIGEMTSQFMLWQVFPDWLTFENYHLQAFMKATHLAFLHESNCYHSCFPLEYWAFRHGPPIVGRLWREVKKGEDVVMTYKRVTRIEQPRFNDEMFDACRRFVTWDLPRIEKTAARYANQHHTRLDAREDGWFGCPPELAPQNYGYNAIKLTVPAAGTRVRVAFRSAMGAEGFRSVQPEKAGWRYGFLAHRANGERLYSGIYSDPAGLGEITVPEDTKFLWLVVMGAPTEHWIWTKNAPQEQWPYTFKLDGAAPDPETLKK